MARFALAGLLYHTVLFEPKPHLKRKVILINTLSTSSYGMCGNVNLPGPRSQKNAQVLPYVFPSDAQTGSKLSGQTQCFLISTLVSCACTKDVVTKKMEITERETEKFLKLILKFLARGYYFVGQIVKVFGLTN